MTSLVDKTGSEIQRILDAKAVLTDDTRAAVATTALGGYLNATYRSLRNRLLGLERAARLDATESLPYLLTAIFALERRVRPFNKYLEWERGSAAKPNTVLPDAEERLDLSNRVRAGLPGRERLLTEDAAGRS